MYEKKPEMTGYIDTRGNRQKSIKWYVCVCEFNLDHKIRSKTMFYSDTDYRYGNGL